MREIKFRIWNAKIKLLSKPFGFEAFDVDYFIPEGWYTDTDDLRIMQFTGLQDKNGKDIYEGDAVEITNPQCQIQKKTLRGVVVFAYASFGVEITRVVEWVGYNVDPPEICWFLNIHNSSGIEVIGNIHEGFKI